MSEIQHQDDLAPRSKMLYLIKPHFFFFFNSLREEKLQQGKKIKQPEKCNRNKRWNGQILTSVKGKIKLLIEFEPLWMNFYKRD